VNAKTCEIKVGGMTILKATNLKYTGTRKILGGLGGVVMDGSVETVRLEATDWNKLAALIASGEKPLEIKLTIL
jgi:hypothetical protein